MSSQEQQAIIAASGEDTVWDFTSLDSIGAYSVTLEPAQTGLNHSFYPNADFVYNLGDTLSNFFQKTDDGLMVLGSTIKQDTAILSLMAGKEKLLSFPSSYDTGFVFASTDTSSVIAATPMISSRFISIIDETSHIDRWGIAKMPKGDFPVIRQHKTRRVILLLQVNFPSWSTQDKDTSYYDSYVWWTKDSVVKWPLVEVRYDTTTGSMQDTISYINITPNQVTSPPDTGGNGGGDNPPSSIQDISLNQVKVSPNPAIHNVHFALAQEGQYVLRVMDIKGRQVIRKTFTGKSYNLNINKLSKGVYVYNLFNRKNKQRLKGKFVKE